MSHPIQRGACGAVLEPRDRRFARPAERRSPGRVRAAACGWGRRPDARRRCRRDGRRRCRRSAGRADPPTCAAPCRVRAGRPESKRTRPPARTPSRRPSAARRPRRSWCAVDRSGRRGVCRTGSGIGQSVISCRLSCKGLCGGASCCQHCTCTTWGLLRLYRNRGPSRIFRAKAQRGTQRTLLRTGVDDAAQIGHSFPVDPRHRIGTGGVIDSGCVPSIAGSGIPADAGTPHGTCGGEWTYPGESAMRRIYAICLPLAWAAGGLLLPASAGHVSSSDATIFAALTCVPVLALYWIALSVRWVSPRHGRIQLALSGITVLLLPVVPWEIVVRQGESPALLFLIWSLFFWATTVSALGGVVLRAIQRRWIAEPVPRKDGDAWPGVQAAVSSLRQSFDDFHARVSRERESLEGLWREAQSQIASQMATLSRVEKDLERARAEADFYRRLAELSKDDRRAILAALGVSIGQQFWVGLVTGLLSGVLIATVQWAIFGKQ